LGTIFAKKVSMQFKLFFFVLFLGSFSAAQEGKDGQITFNEEIAEMDTISDENTEPYGIIELETANMLQLYLRTDMEKKYYVWLRKRVRDVWPYVKIAVDEYNAIQDTSKYFKSEREQKKYIKKRQKVLADEFEEKLKDLTLSRGQILIKLIHRETGKTSYEIIRELRGGVNAFIWNSLGGAYDWDLRTEFDPHKTREDLFIEAILQKDFATGRLERIREFE